MVEVVILGGGFSGVRAGLTLRKKIHESDNIHVTLIDRNSFHLFTPSLYEVATAQEPKRNIAIPIHAIFDSSIEIVKGEVQKIDTFNRTVLLDSKMKYQYDYLILALGSNNEDFGIPGVEEYGIPLKTLSDAVRIKNALQNAKKIVVGGGGFSGTELACEFIAHHGQKDITLIQGAETLLRELGDGIASLAKKRLQDGNAQLILGERIKKVSKGVIQTESGKTYPYDLFIWTGGVKANNLLGELKVDKMLRISGLKNVFAAGDMVVPGTAPVAEDMGKIAAENVYRSIKGQLLTPYRYRHLPYIVPLGKRFAAVAIRNFYLSGFLGFLLQQFVFLHYLLSVLPFFKAFKRFNKFESHLIQ